MPKPLARPHDLKRDDLIIEIINPDGSGIVLPNGVEVIHAYEPRQVNGVWRIQCREAIDITMAPNSRARLAE